MCLLFLYFLQDQLSADMYNFVAKEIDYANYFQTVSTWHFVFVLIFLSPPSLSTFSNFQDTQSSYLPLILSFSQLIEVQAEYHRKSLALLQNVLPQIKAQQGKSARISVLLP